MVVRGTARTSGQAGFSRPLPSIVSLWVEPE